MRQVQVGLIVDTLDYAQRTMLVGQDCNYCLEPLFSLLLLLRAFMFSLHLLLSLVFTACFIAG